MLFFRKLLQRISIEQRHIGRTRKECRARRLRGSAASAAPREAPRTLGPSASARAFGCGRGDRGVAEDLEPQGHGLGRHVQWGQGRSALIAALRLCDFALKTESN